MNKLKVFFVYVLSISAIGYSQTAQAQYVNTSVELTTSDTILANLHKAAEKVCKSNEKVFAGKTVLIEGGGYHGIWLETQPMGGEMYAKRNIIPAMNNVLFFIEYQSPDGRFPGTIYHDSVMQPLFTHMQGLYFTTPALNLFYWNKKRDKEYLQKIYGSLVAFDNYLWKYRDSDGDGCLETWCVWDTGEDNSSRFTGTKLNSGGWLGETPPDDPVFPYESMDYMSYSYDMRATLAQISVLLGNGKEQEWNDKAKAVQDKIKSYLWDDSRGACFDRDNHNKTIPTLIHNNLRAMYHGSFTQEMADRFVKEHLLNPDEFFTPMPLPSIAVNDPVFRNGHDNDWGGPPMGLTYQRAIRALENYGYFSEITLLGEKLITAVAQKNTFAQQFDPFTSEFGVVDRRTDYGPTTLSVLEYISRFYGVHVQFDEIYWGALGRDKHEISYTQHWDGDAFSALTKGGFTTGTINGREIFKVSNGVRVVTDWNGQVNKIINIKNKPLKVKYVIGKKKGTVELQPNQVYPILI
ncbi:MAG: hypothetical protein LBT83_01215 [Tannerella sp.]|jgi:hypothetical protein|nr:hypothetical protein [Tannerella sp.]